MDAAVGSNASKSIAFRIAGSDKLKIGSNGEIGIGGANYGNPGQVIVSNGSGSAVSWANQTNTYTAGNGVTISGNTISIGQDVAQTATPTFYDVTCSNNLNVNGVFSFDRRDSNVSRLRANTSTQTGIAGMNPNIYMGNIDTNDSNGGETANRMGFDFTFRDNHGNNSLHTLFRAYSTSYNGNGHFQVFGAAYLHNNYTSSDDRYKHGETNITNGLEIVRKLVPQTYKKTRSMLDVDNDGTDIGVEGEDWFWESGLIAQEVEQIDELSRYVTSLDDKKQLSYNNIHTYTLAGVKELDTIVQQQAQLIKSLEARIQMLENN
jgi:hypothetical protein